MLALSYTDFPLLIETPYIVYLSLRKGGGEREKKEKSGTRDKKA